MHTNNWTLPFSSRSIRVPAHHEIPDEENYIRDPQVVGFQQRIVCIGGSNIDTKLSLVETFRKNVIATKPPLFEMSRQNVRDKKLSLVETFLLNKLGKEDKIEKYCGGVARNIAENLSKLGHSVNLISVVGNDENGNCVKEYSRNFFEFHNIRVKGDYPTGSYVALLDEKGELIDNECNMDIFDQIDVCSLEQYTPIILASELVILDTNFPRDTINYIIKVCKDNNVPLIISAVEHSKMDRLPKSLEGVSYLICNIAEAESYLGEKMTSFTTLQKGLRKFLAKGLSSIIITRGPESVFYASIKDDLGEVDVHPVHNIIDVTGAGDAFVSGIACGALEKLGIKRSCELGIKLSYATLTTKKSSADNLSPSILQSIIQNFKKQGLNL